MPKKKVAAESAANVPLAIVGMGCLFPKADELGAYWANIKNGVDAITEIPSTHWGIGDYHDEDPKAPDMTYAKRGGFLSAMDFNPMDYGIPPNVLEAIDTSQLLGLVAAGAALKDAGYGPEADVDRDRISVLLGVTGALELVVSLGSRLGHPKWRKAMQEAGIEDSRVEDAMARIGDSYVPWQENSFPGLLGNVVAGRISKQFDLGGTNCVVDAACGSSLGALHMAGLELAAGRSDMVVTGGVDTFNDIFMYMCFSKTPALSPTGNAKPFDAEGDGTIIGEGLGMVVMKRLADAERDGDKIYAVVRGIGSSSDGKGDAIYAPSAKGQQKALRATYDLAGIDPASIELVEAHGTGTKVGDAVEVTALRQVYGDSGGRPWCALGSVKSQIGHTKAAAGAAGIIKAALALHNKVLPPTIKVGRPLPVIEEEASPFYVNGEIRPWVASPNHPRRAAVSALGFGGSNFHAVLEEYGSQKQASDWDGEIQLLAFSADSAAALEKSLAPFAGEISWPKLRSLAAASRASFEDGANCRLALVVEKDRTDLASQIAGARKMLQKNPDADSWNTPDGATYARGEQKGKLGILFPGQGAQYTGMLRDLACQFPQALGTIEEANASFGEAKGRRLSDFIFPPAAFDQKTKEADEAALRSTDVAQPAIGAVSLGALRILESFGLVPDATAGHSYGELTALCAAGRYEEKALHALSNLRGKLMAGDGEDKGTMLAVSAPLAEVETLLAEEGLDLVLANKNAPTQAILSGSRGEIARAEEILAARKMKSKQIPVAAAFHSRLVADASVPFLAETEKIDFLEGTLPVYANTTAEPYPAGAAESRELLAAQLAKPVEFVNQIERMHADGIGTFLEVGPGARLTGLVKAILGKKDFQALAIDASAGKRSGIADLARALAQLAVLGHGVDLAAWDGGFVPAEPGKKPLMTFPICGANYVKERPKRPPVAPAPVVVETAPAKATPKAAEAVPAKAAPVKQAAAPVQQLAATAAPVAAGSLAEALRMTQENMAALQKLQEQTASLHHQFLEGQESAGRTFQSLLEQQQRLLGSGNLSAPAPAFAAPVSAPAPATAVVSAPVPAPAPAAAAPVARAAAPVSAPIPAPAPASNGGERVAKVLLSVIAEKTGYPEEMLELDMGLDSDLGIDSIKRVEILSALQEELPEAPTMGPEELGSLQSLRQIVEHLAGAMPSVAPAAPAPSTAGSEKVAKILLSVIAEKTGYPEEMLELEMGLDSDLGIDSIKRVEILSALQEELPEAPTMGPEELGSLQTLRQIVEHLAGAMPAPAPAPEKSAPAPSAGAADKVAEVLLRVIAEKTGYPTELLELEMGLEADLGIDSIKRVEILSSLQEELPDAPAMGPEELGSLQTLGQIVEHLAGAMPAPAPAAEKSAPAPSAGSADKIAEVLLRVIAEKTGYPTEMLELEMGLEADLGIDSIKRVEILSALQEELPEAPAMGPEELGSLQTLGQIVEHLAGAMPAAAPAASSTTAPAADSGNIAAILLQVIAEKTGYPTEMLELEMNLEADLGIDSIKRVEILSALQEELPEAPAMGPEELGSLQTLGQIVEHLAGAMPASAPAAPVATAPVADSDKIAAILLGVIAEKTGYPTEMLGLEMALEADLGIDSIKRVEILSTLQEELPEAPAMGPDELASLQSLGQIVDFLCAPGASRAPAEAAPPQAVAALPEPAGVDRQVVRIAPADLPAPISIAEGAEIWVAEDGSNLSGEIVRILLERRYNAREVSVEEVAEIEAPEALGALVIPSPAAGADDSFLLAAFSLVQLAGPALKKSAETGGATLMTVSRLDGSFGLAKRELVDPTSGGLSGLAKTAGHEWEKVNCKALDIGSEAENAASMIVEEIFLDGPSEVFFEHGEARTLKLVKVDLEEKDAAAPLQPGEVVVVTGGARGVTAEVAEAIGRAMKPTLVLLGRSEMPPAEQSWLAGIEAEGAIKKAILANAGRPLKPKELAEEYRSIVNSRELRANLKRIEATGAVVLYRSVDVRDGEAVRSMLEEIRAQHGPVRGLVHGAGVLADRLIEDKTPEQFEMVYGTKIAGLRSFLDALADEDLRFMALFSSSTGRFGRKGQVDYAVANEVLNKIAQQQRRLRPGCRVVSVNWGPWDGGMVTPALKKIFAAEGVPVIDLRGGSDYLVREISVPEGPVEIVILGESEEAAAPSAPERREEPKGPMNAALEIDLDVDQYPFLRSHVIDGKAVLPMAMTIEWLAQGALQTNPGLRFHGFDEVRILKGVILEGSRCNLQVMTGKGAKSEGMHHVPVELVGGPEGSRIVHARGEIVLADRLPEGTSRIERGKMPPLPYADGEIYSPGRLFHGPAFRGIESVAGCSEEGIVASVKAAPTPAEWIADPLRGSWLTDPLAVDCAFQAMILWSLEKKGAASLPCFAGSYRQFAGRFPAAGTEIRVRVTKSTTNQASAVIEFVDREKGTLVARMEDYQCVIDSSLALAFAANELCVEEGAA